jgi:hypothetical protein
MQSEIENHETNTKEKGYKPIINIKSEEKKQKISNKIKNITFDFSEVTQTR